ncbi:MAG: restriction endonuclease subunit S, partial [Pirellula sp.]
PLPPLAEQRRIVEKVDQLMGLCDELAARQAVHREARTALVGATLDRVVSVRTAAEFPTQAKRLRNNFDLLFDTPTTIPHLRRAILQQAVQGQLVPQDPNDEPASETVQRVRIERATLIADGRLREEKLLLPTFEASNAHLPLGWADVRLGHVINCLDHIRRPVSKFVRDTKRGKYPYYGANGQVGWIDDFLFDEDLVLVVEDESFIGRVKPFSYKITGKTWVNNHAHVLQPTFAVNADFLNYALSFYPFTPLTSGTTNRKKLTKAGLLNAPFRLPPLAEQKLIASKVTELLSLCDALEAKLTQAESASTELLSATVQHLLDGSKANA